MTDQEQLHQTTKQTDVVVPSAQGKETRLQRIFEEEKRNRGREKSSKGTDQGVSVM